MPHSTRIEWAASESEAAIDLYRRMPGDGYSAEVVRIVKPTQTDFRLNSEASYIALLDVLRADGETIVADSQRSHLKDLRNKITFVPSGCAVEGWSLINNKSASFTAVYLEPPAVDQSEYKLSQLPPQLLFEDSTIRTTVEKIRAVVEDPSFGDALYCETLSLMLIMELYRRQNSGNAGFAPQRGGLTPRQIRVVTDFMESNLACEISLTDFANLLELSRFHVVRAFKQSTGWTPYQYLLRRRVMRAKEMLGETELPVREIAATTGFHGPTQLNRAFRKVFGTTPGQFRRNG